MDAGRQLHCGQRLHVVGGGVRDVGNHGGSTVDVTEGLSEQHGELTVPE